MAKKQPPFDTPSPVAEAIETAAYTDRAGEMKTDDEKLTAFNAIITALKPVSQADRYSVLNAAAKFHGFSIKLDV